MFAVINNKRTQPIIALWISSNTGCTTNDSLPPHRGTEALLKITTILLCSQDENYLINSRWQTRSSMSHCASWSADAVQCITWLSWLPGRMKPSSHETVTVLQITTASVLILEWVERTRRGQNSADVRTNHRHNVSYYYLNNVVDSVLQVNVICSNCGNWYYWDMNT